MRGSDYGGARPRRYDGSTMDWDKPDSPEDWLARLTVIPVLTLAISGVLVGVVMHLILGAPTWSLVVGVLVVAACLTWLAFSPDFEESDEIVSWVQKRPDGPAGWFKFAGQAIAAWGGLCLIVNRVILDELVGASTTTQVIVAASMLPLAFAGEFLLGEAEEGSAPEAAAEHPDESPGLVDA